MKSKLHYLVILLCGLFVLSCETTEINNKQSFDFDWRFALGDIPNAQEPDFDDSEWRLLDVPHDYSIEHGFDKNNKSGGGGGFVFGGIGWYRKQFVVDETSENKKTFILFNGIYRNSEVWINNHYLGIRPYGYSSFYYDLTPHLNPAGETNIIAVKANTSEQMNSRWYTGAGIYRHVWLITTDKVHFDEWGVFAQTKTADNKNAQLSIDVELVNEHNTAKEVQIITSLSDVEGKEITDVQTNYTLEASDSKTVSQELLVSNPNLWSIKNPYLYNLKVEIKAGDEILDVYSAPFGIRTFKFDPNKGFILNGEQIKLKGVNNHHAGGPLGAACMDYTFERQIQILKKMGCNALRMSHNPPAPELLDAADRMGMVVIDEIFDEWQKGKTEHGYAPHFYEWYERDIKNWMKRDRNHASVVAWSIGNEVPEQWDDIKGPEVGKLILEAARKYDTSRPFTIGADGVKGLNSSGLGEMLELVGYNYQEQMYKSDHETYPDRVIYGSETVMYPYHPGDCWQMHSYEEWLSNFNEDYVAGEFIWTGFDYLGEAGIGDVIKECDKPDYWGWWPSRGAACGLVDICGFEKPAYQFRKAIWNDEPMVYIAVETDSTAKRWTNNSFWNWPKLEAHWNHKTEGDTLAVHVYTNVPDIELLLNGESLGTKHWDLQEQAFLIWNIPYKKGILEAIGTLPNGETISFEVQTAGKPAKIKLVPDRQNIKANKQDLSYVKAYVLDENDLLVPFAENNIEFEVSGAGILNAVGNGNQNSHTPLKGKQMEAYLGKCLAIVQSGGEKGIITLTAKSEGLPDTTVEIVVE